MDEFKRKKHKGYLYTVDDNVYRLVIFKDPDEASKALCTEEYAGYKQISGTEAARMFGVAALREYCICTAIHYNIDDNESEELNKKKHRGYLYAKKDDAFILRIYENRNEASEALRDGVFAKYKHLYEQISDTEADTEADTEDDSFTENKPIGGRKHRFTEDEQISDTEAARLKRKQQIIDRACPRFVEYNQISGTEAARMFGVASVNGYSVAVKRHNDNKDEVLN